MSERAKRKKANEAREFPRYCDYSCPHADFAPKDAIGDCRKDLAVWCTVVKRFNNKNNKCIASG